MRRSWRFPHPFPSTRRALCSRILKVHRSDRIDPPSLGVRRSSCRGPDTACTPNYPRRPTGRPPYLPPLALLRLPRRCSTLTVHGGRRLRAVISVDCHTKIWTTTAPFLNELRSRNLIHSQSPFVVAQTEMRHPWGCRRSAPRQHLCCCRPYLFYLRLGLPNPIVRLY